MGIYLEDAKLDSVLEAYFEEENNLIYESCMIEYLSEMCDEEAINEAKKTDKEKEAEKKEKFEARIAKAKKSIKKLIQKKMIERSNKYKKFRLDCHEATNQERAQYVALVAAAGATSTAISGVGDGIEIAGGIHKLKKMQFSKDVIKMAAKAGAKELAKDTIKAGAIATAIVVGGHIIYELIKMKRYKDVYTIKLYGIKEDGSEKLIGWWTSVKIQKSDLDSEFKSKIK